jgi:hypothetical protein
VTRGVCQHKGGSLICVSAAQKPEGWVGARQFHPSGLTGSEFRCFPEALGDFDVSVIASRHKGIKKHGRRAVCSQSREAVVLMFRRQASGM